MSSGALICIPCTTEENNRKWKARLEDIRQQAAEPVVDDYMMDLWTPTFGENNTKLQSLAEIRRQQAIDVDDYPGADHD